MTDWPRAWRIGEDLARDQVRRGDPVDDSAIMWALLCDAAKVSRIAYKAPPPQGFPGKSVMPDAPEEISAFAKMRAYLSGELEEMPEEASRDPQPDAAAIDRAEAVLWLWHNEALNNKGARSNLKKAVYAKALGVPDRKVRAKTGLTREQIKHAKRQAVSDMLAKIGGQL